MKPKTKKVLAPIFKWGLILIVFVLIFEKQIMEGVMAGGVKQ